MNLSEIYSELKSFKLTKYKLVNFGIALFSLLLYEFVGRTIYRPFIYENKINDFHIADTLGNSLGTFATVFFLVFLFSSEKKKGIYMIEIGTLSVAFFELLHPLLGKPIDFYDIAATFVAGVISYFVYISIFRKHF